MALTWNTSNVFNRNEVDTDPYDEKSWHPVCSGLVWLSMSCGYNEITEKNFEEVAQRIAIHQHILGAYFRKGDERVYITRVDVMRYIGLRTNASTMTKVQFNKRVAQWLMEDAPYYIDKQLEHNSRKAAFTIFAKTTTETQGATV
jgi:hypothetical protein